MKNNWYKIKILKNSKNKWKFSKNIKLKKIKFKIIKLEIIQILIINNLVIFKQNYKLIHKIKKIFLY
jgi:hypothetical protein